MNGAHVLGALTSLERQLSLEKAVQRAVVLARVGSVDYKVIESRLHPCVLHARTLIYRTSR